ncbi:MAG: polysaccharide biosynthesis C-terminal domain-containing protein, partial [Candidatus Paceibacterota bacterium]
IFDFFIDPKFYHSQEVSKILVVGLVFWGGYSYFISYLLHNKMNRINGLIALIAMTVNLLLNYFLINDFGIQGAAYATVITYVCMFVLSIIFTFRRT